MKSMKYEVEIKLLTSSAGGSSGLTSSASNWSAIILSSPRDGASAGLLGEATLVKPGCQMTSRYEV